MINVNYCILVTITADAIAFRYNRSDGDNRFVDYAPNGEVNMPFAILCTGNKFVIGRSAYEAHAITTTPTPMPTYSAPARPVAPLSLPTATNHLANCPTTPYAAT